MATDVRRERRLALVLGAVFAAIAVLTAVDLAGDFRQGVPALHVALEAAVVLGGASGLLVMAARYRALRAHALELEERTEALQADLTATRRDAERWREEAAHLIHGLSSAIDAQLTRWELSAAEKEVALLLLKGLSHKEIADLRGTGETTVRQQARALYRKAGLTGRHDLAAFFLEDLLGPREPPARASSL